MESVVDGIKRTVQKAHTRAREHAPEIRLHDSPNVDNRELIRRGKRKKPLELVQSESIREEVRRLSGPKRDKPQLTD